MAIFITTLTLCSAVLTGTVAADVNDFTVTDFKADYYLSNQDPQGQLRVVERINVAFTDQNHGLLRALPKTYKNLPLDIAVTSIGSDTGAPTQYSTYDDGNGNEVIKIGDPNQTVTGTQEYTLAYTEHNVVGFYKDHDELYWDINGNSWAQPFEHVSATLHLPSNLRLSDEAPLCFTGAVGSQEHTCTIAVTATTVSVQTTESLAPSDTLSVVVGFTKGYFAPPTVIDYVAMYLPTLLEVGVPFVLLSGAGFVWWLKRGRDAKGTGIIIPQYDAPDALRATEVGTVVDFRVDSRDITAAVIDLAIRKYLRIVESTTSKLLIAKQQTYSLELLNSDWSSLNDWEQELMSGLFGLRGQTPVFVAGAANVGMVASVRNVRKLVEQSLTTKGYFVSDPMKYTKLSVGTILIVGAVVLSNTAFTGGSVWWGIIAGGVVGGLFYHFSSARTAKGVAALEHIKGLKLYLDVAEKDRIAMLQSPNAPYAPTSPEPTHTVDLFEKLLPYAIALKVEKQWAKKFDDIYRAAPDWYVGNYNSFSTGYLIGSLSGGFASAVNTSFAPAASSGASGFGGGGFAGGGGGGGGGGGW